MPLGVVGAARRTSGLRDASVAERSRRVRSARGTPIPASRMDHATSPLAGLVDALASSERFARVRGRLPGERPRLRARAPARPRDAAGATSVDRSSACSPRTRRRATSPRRSAGTSIPLRSRCSRAAACAPGSGLEPPAHLVGERARALDVLARGGLVCVSARALAEGIAPAGRAPQLVRLREDAGGGLDDLVERLALAGYERVERVEERGQIAVRGGLVDVFPSTGREPLRIEFFGDEVEQSARSPRSRSARSIRSTTRRSIPAARACRRTSSALEEDGPENDAPLLDRAARPRLAARRRRACLGGGGTRPRPTSTGRRGSTRCPRSQPHVFEAQRPAIAARGLAEAENELAAHGPPGAARDRDVPAPGRGAAHAATPAQGRGGRP